MDKEQHRELADCLQEIANEISLLREEIHKVAFGTDKYPGPIERISLDDLLDLFNLMMMEEKGETEL